MDSTRMIDIGDKVDELNKSAVLAGWSKVKIYQISKSTDPISIVVISVLA